MWVDVRVSPDNRFKSLSPESLPRSPAFQDNGGSQAMLFAQILDKSAIVPAGLQKILSLKLGLCWLTACRNAKMAYNPHYTSSSFKHIEQTRGTNTCNNQERQTLIEDQRRQQTISHWGPQNQDLNVYMVQV
jgi:hypothetical protein